MKLLLGSGSPGRRLVLERMGLSFDWLTTNTNEKTANGLINIREAEKLLLDNSNNKMDSLIDLLLKENKISMYNVIITADTNVWFNNNIYGKPQSVTEARNMLYSFKGLPHTIITGMTISIISDSNIKEIFNVIDHTDVYFTDNQNLIDFYLLTDEWKGKAGAYAIQGLGTILITSINGNFDNIIGLNGQKIIQSLLAYDQKFIDLLHN